MGFFDWILNIFGKKNEPKLLTSSSSSNEELEREERERVHRERNKRNEIISESQDFIKKLHDLVKFAKNTIYQEKFEKTLETTKKIHDKIIADEKVSIAHLRQFHNYFTNEFINTFDEALNDLKPKKAVDVKLQSSYKLQQELDEERKKKEQENILNNVQNLGIKERVEMLLKHLNPNWGLIQEQGFHDVMEKESTSELKITFADKYTNYVINNWSLSNDVKFIGALSDNVDSPIIYNLKTLEVFKLLYTTNKPEKLGEITDSFIRNILQNNFNDIDTPVSIRRPMAKRP